MLPDLLGYVQIFDFQYLFLNFEKPSILSLDVFSPEFFLLYSECSRVLDGKVESPSIWLTGGPGFSSSKKTPLCKKSACLALKGLILHCDLHSFIYRIS